VVEQAVGEVVGGAVLAQARDRGCERCRDIGPAVVVGETGAGQVALGAQHRGEVAGLVRVEQREQFADGGGVTQVVGGP